MFFKLLLLFSETVRNVAAGDSFPLRKWFKSQIRVSYRPAGLVIISHLGRLTPFNLYMKKYIPPLTFGKFNS